MLKKALIIALLLFLFPILLKISFFLFVVFLLLSLALSVAFFLMQKNLLRQLRRHAPDGEPLRMSRPAGSENVVIDVHAERKN